jgi:hypothetical protein
MLSLALTRSLDLLDRLAHHNTASVGHTVGPTARRNPYPYLLISWNIMACTTLRITYKKVGDFAAKFR